MPKPFAAVAKLFLAASLTAGPITLHADITLNLFAGQLTFADGSAMPDDGLVILLASTSDSTFNDPTPTAFSSGDDVEIHRWALGGVGAGNGAGETLEAVQFSLSGSLNANDPLRLYWYPTLTLATAAGGPGAGTPYGTFRTDSITTGSTIAWNVPSDGNTESLTFQTIAAGGSLANDLGKASLTVVPEPATYALAAGAACLAAGALSRRFRQRRG